MDTFTMIFRISTVLYTTLLWVGVRGVTIHFTTPGKTLIGSAGVVRATLDVDTLLNNQSAYLNQSLVKTQFICAKVGDTTIYRLNVKSLSFDAPMTRTYIQIEPDIRDDLASAVIGDTCDPQANCSSFDKLAVYMKRVQTKDKGFINSLASWDGTQYFIYTPDGDDAVYFGYRPYLQLRQVTDGYVFPTEDYPDPMDVHSFSSLLVNFKAMNASVQWMQAGSRLLILPGEGNGLVFLTVVRVAEYPNPPRDTQLKNFGYALFAVSVGGWTGDEAALLYQSENTWEGWYKHKLMAEGGISYKDGTLCWTMGDTVLCGKWSPEQPLEEPTDISPLLKSGQAPLVCNEPADRDDYIYDNVTTGVVIAETLEENGRLVVFFGCSASQGGAGGFGMIVQKQNPASTQIIPIVDKDGPLLAGAMFATPDALCVPYTVHGYIPNSSLGVNCQWTNLNCLLLVFMSYSVLTLLNQ